MCNWIILLAFVVHIAIDPVNSVTFSPVFPETGKKYWKVGPDDWSRCSAACESIKGQLATISSRALQEFFLSQFSLASENFWIGLTDKWTERTMVWLDRNKAPCYRDWGPGEPTIDGFLDCTRVTPTGWYVVKCDKTHTHYGVCESLETFPVETQSSSTNIGDITPVLDATPVITAFKYGKLTSPATNKVFIQTSTLSRLKCAALSIQSGGISFSYTKLTKDCLIYEDYSGDYDSDKPIAQPATTAAAPTPETC